MKPKTRLILITGMVLAAALLLTGTAFAEGEEPPPVPADEEALPEETAPPPEPQIPIPAEEPVSVEEPLVEPPAEELTPVEESVSEPPTEEPTPIDEPVVEPPVEEPPAETLPAEVALPLEEPLEEALPAEETLVEELVLVDEAGQVMDLDSQAASESLAAADPYFTTGGGATKYCFVATGICDGSCSYCNGTLGTTGTPITNPIQVAIDYIGANTLVLDNGTLKVEKATYVGAVMIDQTTYTNLTALTKLEGQLDAGIYPTISGTLTLKNLTTGFWLDGFNVTGGVTIKDSNLVDKNITVSNVTGALALSNLDIRNAAGYGISVSSHKGNITLANVKSSNNLTFGADINNNSGAPGNVTITNCAFDHNNGGAGDTGLNINTSGVVTINGLSASYNGEYGLLVQYFSNLSLKNAVLMWNDTGYGGYIFTHKAAPVLLENVISRNNGNPGLYIGSAGSVTLRSVDAHTNYIYGICIDATTGAGAVSLTNIRVGGTISGPGLFVVSKGAITITSIIANGNAGNGVSLDNAAGTGGVTITSPAAAGIAGANAFYGNTNGCGVYIRSKGAVTLTNLDVYDNSKYGIDINNSGGTAGVAINKNLPNWYNGVFNNLYSGILIVSKGAIAISDTTAYLNDYYGIYIQGVGAGSSVLTNVSAYENGQSGGAYQGLRIDNTAGTGGVTIRSTVAANYLDYGRNNWGGIDIRCKGAVSVSNVDVSDNPNASGLYIENYHNTTASPAVTISYGFFNRNAWNGVTVYAKGLITLVNVEACQNGGEAGVKLDNYTNGGAGAVTIRSSDARVFYEFSKNTGEGIRILARGAVSVSNVSACANQLDGIHIENHNASSDLPVTLTNVVADGNTQNGLFLYSRGVVTLVNTGASNNGHSGGGYYGATISNWNGTALTGVTIRSTVAATNYGFCGNGQDGIFIWSEGPVSVGNVIALENGWNGMYIRRYSGSGAISVSHSTFDYNTRNGLIIDATYCAVTLTDVSASYNDPDPSGTNYSGVVILNTYDPVAASSVTIKSSLTTNLYAFSRNTDYGISITSEGPVSVSNVVAEENINSGVFIDNHNANIAAPAAVSVLRSTSSGSGTGYGFHIYTIGSVTLTNLTANENHLYGVNVVASDLGVTAPANVTVNGTNNNFDENITYGIHIETEGAISLFNVSACGTDNGPGTSAGISLTNNYTGATAGVTISASTTGWNYACGNDDRGLEIDSRGPITISRLVVVENDGTGGVINNIYSDPLIKNVTLTACDFSWNGGTDGLSIYSLGAVTLNSVTVDSNEHNGLSINTNGLVTLNGVSACNNSIHEGEISGGSAVITERLTSDVEGDIWYFTATQASNIITLSSSDIDAFLVLYEWDGVAGEWDYKTENDNYGGGSGIDDARIEINVDLGSEWKILVTTPEKWGEPGQYVLDLNGGPAIPIEHALGAAVNNYTGTGGVTVLSPATFWSKFSENNYTGLGINTTGAVSITNSSASYNGYDGIRIVGHPLAVSVRNTSTTTPMQISNNVRYGISAPAAFGAITLSGRIFLNDNGGYGAYMCNDGAPIATPMPVTISGVTASGNKNGDGIYITTIGQVTISNVTACKNNSLYAGLYVNNSSIAARSLTISGTNILSSNVGHGLELYSNGLVSISGVRTEGNSESGLYVYATGTGKGVTLSNIISQYNAKDGININAFGVVTCTNVRSNLNGAGSNGAGIRVNANEAYPIYFNYCTIIGNEGSGIYANDGTPSWLHLTGTLYFGNDSNWSGDSDIGTW